jgi:hypothetical protein
MLLFTCYFDLFTLEQKCSDVEQCFSHFLNFLIILPTFSNNSATGKMSIIALGSLPIAFITHKAYKDPLLYDSFIQAQQAYKVYTIRIKLITGIR